MSITGQLFLPPAVPHAWDEEFLGTTLDAKWLLAGSSSNLDPTEVELYAAVASGDVRISVGQRESWLRMQAGPTGSARIGWSPGGIGVELPDGTYWCRYAPSWSVPAIANDGAAYFALTRSVNAENYYQMGMELDTNACNRSFIVRTNNTNKINFESTDLETRGEMHEYLAFTKVGTLITGWSANPSGQWMRYGSYSYDGPGVIDSIGVWSQNTNTVNPGSKIAAFDFIRYRPDGELP